jgi:beta-galactosidase/beta-glucuronidase
MVRSNWQSLDGVWYCAFSRQRTIPDDIDTTIIVPFSPEAKSSGVCRTLKPEETMFYRKHFSYRHTPGTRVLLHFQAVDQECVVFLNEKTLGSHVGGYIPFWFDVTQNIREKNDLFVIVTDKHDLSPLPKGKQRLKPSTVFSAAQSGIWQSVWLEEVPWEYISSITLYPDLAGERFSLMVTTNTEGNNPVTVTYDGKTISGLSDVKMTCMLKDPHPWSPDDPFLYTLSITCGQDTVQSYLAMRSFGVKDQRLLLNGEPFFHHGVLYQGYWKDGLYTPPDDHAVEDDLRRIKAFGFNTIRLHQKVESLKWYHLCDTLGLIVWQDMPSGGLIDRKPLDVLPGLLRSHTVDDTRKHAFLGSDDRAYRLEFLAELKGMVRLLYNSPCIGMWTVFSCGLGQFDSSRIMSQIQVMDPGRIVNPADGRYDQGGGEVRSVHLYSLKYKPQRDGTKRAVLITDFGGYSCNAGNGYCYRSFPDKTSYNKALLHLYRDVILPAKRRGLSGCVYTQFHDTEFETDGLVSYDRATVRITQEAALAIRRMLFQNG